MFWKGNHTFAGALTTLVTKMSGLVGMGWLQIPTQSATPAIAAFGTKNLYIASDESLRTLGAGGYPTLAAYSDQNTALSYACARTWTASASATEATYWYDVAWSPSLKMFAMVGSSGTTASIQTSTDGIAWTNRTSPTSAASWNSVVWAPEANSGNGMFVAVGTAGVNGAAMSSTNGTSWSAATLTGTNLNPSLWKIVRWVPELNKFIALSAGGATTGIMTSANGTSWTAGTVQTNSGLNGLAWAAGLGAGSGRLIALAQDDAFFQYSDDGGTTWAGSVGTTPTPSSSTKWLSVCWSPKLSLFVAVANKAAGNPVIMTSPTGVAGTWTLRNSTFNSLRGVCWSEELEIFAAVAFNPTGSFDVFVSYNGIDWTSRASSKLDSGWNNICWSPENSLFVAAGGTSAVTTNRVLRSL